MIVSAPTAVLRFFMDRSVSVRLFRAWAPSRGFSHGFTELWGHTGWAARRTCRPAVGEIEQSPERRATERPPIAIPVPAWSADLAE
jgi:hypothetical protein